MSNIRVDLDTPIKDGTEVVFRSPVDCSQVTGLIVYYNGGSQEFMFADAHGNNVGDIDHLFAENVAVKVILDVTTGMAFVQNADTNAYLEGRFESLEKKVGSVKDAFQIELYSEVYYGDEGFYAGSNNSNWEMEIAGWAANIHLLGRTLHVKTYAYDNAFYGLEQVTLGEYEEYYEWLVHETANPDADITKDPKSGVCEFDITIPRDIPANGYLIVSIPYAKNPYTKLEVYEKKNAVWNEIYRLGVNHIIAHGFYDWGNEEYCYWRQWSDGFAEVWRHGHSFVDDYQSNGEVAFYVDLPFDIDINKRFHITMDACGYTYDDNENESGKAPLTYMWAEPISYCELYLHAFSPKPELCNDVDCTLYFAGYWNNTNEEEYIHESN